MALSISSRCDYACRAMVALARRGSSDEPTNVPTIAEAEGIPEKYLVHILLSLKRAGLVRSVRGAAGGYMLSHSPEDTSLGDVVRAIDGPVMEPRGTNGTADDRLAGVWKRVAREIDRTLDGITLRDILDAVSGSRMYYI